MQVGSSAPVETSVVAVFPSCSTVTVAVISFGSQNPANPFGAVVTWPSKMS